MVVWLYFPQTLDLDTQSSAGSVVLPPKDLIISVMHRKHGTEERGRRMTGNEYQVLAMRTNDKRASERLTQKMDDHDWSSDDLGGIIDGCLGLSGEVGEVNDMVKKWIFHEGEMDWTHLKKELGDVLWYVALMCSSIGWNLDDVLQLNIDKLKERYPEGFDPDRSAHRKEGDV